MSAFFGILVGISVGFIAGDSCAKVFWRNQAVRAGVAEYHIETNSFSKEFRYLPPCK